MSSLYEKIRIIHIPSSSEPFVILDKPRGLPSAPLKAGDESALTFVLQSFPEAGNVKGRKEIEHGLVHRIDTETRGLLLVALSQEFYDTMIKEQTNGRFFKTYTAECDQVNILDLLEGFPQLECSLEDVVDRIKKFTNESSLDCELKSRFRPFGLKNREVRPVTQNSGKAAEKKAGVKEYSTAINLSKADGTIHAECRIREGYRHQVRCHLAWLGLPIKGDPVYNPSAFEGQDFLFTATGLEFLGFFFSLK